MPIPALKPLTAPLRPRPTPPSSRPVRPATGLAALLGATVLFALPLGDLLAFAWNSSLYSHIPLVPVVSGALLWLRRAELLPRSTDGRGLALLFATLSALTLLAYGATRALDLPLPHETRLCLTTTSYLLLVVAIAAWSWGVPRLLQCLFPLAFLAFTIPLPAGWLSQVELVLQHGSAAVAHAFFLIAGTAVHYDELSFQLPGISLMVAPECSGIHSTLALLIVSTLAGHWFLRTRLRAVILTAAVLPLALLRNGLRIFVIGELCVQRGPGMIDSPLHRQGGPVFFALSLIPFFALVWLLARRARRPS